MINIYDKGETDFTHNGYGKLHAISATVSEELNGAYELSVELPVIVENARVIPYIKGQNILRAPTPRGNQLFRIYDVQKDMQGTITISAQHIFYDLLYNMVGSVATTAAVSSIMPSLASACAYSHRFTLYSDISQSVTVEYLNTNPVNCILGDGGLVDTLQAGELYRDNFTVKLQNAIGEDRGLKIKYRKNLSGLDLQESYGDIATRIKPIARDEEGNDLYLPEVYVDSPHINDYFMPMYSTIELSGVQVGKENYPEASDAYAEMRRQVQAFYAEGGDLPTINAKIDFVLLGNTAEYAEYRNLEQIYLGDIVTATHEELNFSMQAKCIKYTYDAILERYASIELGDPRGEFTSSTSRSIGQLTTEVYSSGSLSGRTSTLETKTTTISSDLSSLTSRVTELESDVTALSKLMSTHAHTGTDGTVKIKSSNLTT